MIAFLASQPASDVTVAQYTTGGEWKRLSAAAQDVDSKVGRKGTNDEGYPKEGDKNDEVHDRGT